MQKSDTDLELENNAHNENRLRLAALGFFERKESVQYFCTFSKSFLFAACWSGDPEVEPHRGHALLRLRVPDDAG